MSLGPRDLGGVDIGEGHHYLHNNTDFYTLEGEPAARPVSASNAGSFVKTFKRL